MNVKLLIAAILLYSDTAHAQPAPEAGRERIWNLYTKTFDGTVSINHNLTKHECEAARILSFPQIDTYTTGTTFIGGNFIIQAECFD